MARPRVGKSKRNGDVPRAERKERLQRSYSAARDRRRRSKGQREGRDDGHRDTRDLYKTDLDRHLWSWASPSGRKERRRREKSRARRRKLARLVASAAGMAGAAGLSYFLYRKLRKNDRLDDAVSAQAERDEDLDEV